MNHAQTMQEQAEVFALQLMNQSPEIDREHLVRQTTSHLKTVRHVSIETARIKASAAVAEIEKGNKNAYFDISHSTSKCLFVMVDGVRQALSLGDVMALLQQEPA
ncbi:hypothetical protein R50073_24350 [Maricurvus nonylphenolicus]|uniref:hypothetical protein n=1 Tax=Maricurvus nonylphenolicus TaxID=1008307 RepID=UPI0036F26C31